MARPSGEKVKCGGQWTQARFNSFIKSALRGASRKWGPMQQCLKDARTRRGYYKCAGCEQEVPATIKVGGKRFKNAVADHIDPVVDPNVGFQGWDECVRRMFVEQDGFQCLCKECHDNKCQSEREIEKARRAKDKSDE